MTEISEYRTAGGVMALPGNKDTNGTRLLEYQQPSSVTETGGIKQWIDDLDDDILDGLLVPREVLEASETGSGYSGRAIPFKAFLSARDVELGDYIRQIKRQVFDPLVEVNFGGEWVERCQIRPVALMKSFGDDPGGLEQAAQPDKGLPGYGQRPGERGMPGGGTGAGAGKRPRDGDGDGRVNEGRQFSTDEQRNNSDKGQWITIGGESRGGKKHAGGVPVKIHRGKIVAGPKALTGRKLSEIAEKSQPDSRLSAAVHRGSRDWRVNKRDLRKAIDFVWQTKKEVVEEREAAKKRAREITGVSAADLARLENSGRDHTHIKGFDARARQVAGEHPELGIGRGYEGGAVADDTDYSAAVWDLIREGKRTPPAKHDPRLIDEAAQLVIAARKKYPARDADEADGEEEDEDEENGRGDAFEGEEDDQDDASHGDVPFSVAEIDAFVEYQDAVRAIQFANDPEFEKKHPRDDAGRFASKSADGDEIGPHGPVFRGFRHDAKGAVAKLMATKGGEAIAALHHPAIGDIDLIWGFSGTPAKSFEDGYGLAKVVAKHSDILPDLQSVIDKMQVVEVQSLKDGTPARVQMESADDHAAISLTWHTTKKTWLLTAFKKQNSPPSAGGTIAVFSNSDSEFGETPSPSSGLVTSIDPSATEGKQFSIADPPPRRDLTRDRTEPIAHRAALAGDALAADIQRRIAEALTEPLLRPRQDRPPKKA